MALLRLAHISDLHFSTTSGRFNPLEEATLALDRAHTALRLILKTGKVSGATYPSTFEPRPALRLLRELASDDLDGVIVTGDLATTGRVSDLEIARDYFHGQAPKSWQPFSDPSLPSLLRDRFSVITLPGNHDRYEGVFNEPGSQNFERVFGRNWDLGRNFAMPVGRSQRVKLAKFKSGNITLAVVLVDMSLTEKAAAQGGITNFVGQGRAIPEPLRSAEAVTSTLRQEYLDRKEPLVVMWAVHFPPGFPGVADELDLVDAVELLHSLWAMGVAGVLAGHTHEHRNYTVRHPRNEKQKVTVFCCGSTTGCGPNNQLSYSILELHSTGPTGLQLKELKYKWNGESFEP